MISYYTTPGSIYYLSKFAEDNHLDFREFWQANKGKENHYSKIGNQKIYDIIYEKLNSYQ